MPDLAHWHSVAVEPGFWNQVHGYLGPGAAMHLQWRQRQRLRCRRVHIMEPGSESLGLTTVICGPRMGRYSSGTNCGVQQRHTLGMVGQSPASGSRAQGAEQQQLSLSNARSKP